MRIGTSLVLIAIGAVLKFAVTAKANGINIGTVGIILMIIGAVGLVISLAMASTRRRTDIVTRPGHTTYVEPNDTSDPRL
jgi:membrane-bound ClpP family serine protease